MIEINDNDVERREAVAQASGVITLFLACDLAPARWFAMARHQWHRDNGTAGSPGASRGGE